MIKLLVKSVKHQDNVCKTRIGACMSMKKIIIIIMREGLACQVCTGPHIPLVTALTVGVHTKSKSVNSKVNIITT